MGIMSKVLSLFTTAKAGTVKATINEATKLVDGLFTSDEERLKWANTMDKLNLASQSAIARTARGALVWAIAINMVYLGVVRDVLIGFGLNLPPATVEYSTLIEKAMLLLTGGVG